MMQKENLIDYLIKHRGYCFPKHTSEDCDRCEVNKFAYGEYRGKRSQDGFDDCDSKVIYAAALKMKLNKIKEILK